MIAAKIEGGVVVDAKVLPDGVDPAAYQAALGIQGEWVEADAGVARGWALAQGKVRPFWVQIPGAGLGPEGEPDGYPVDFEAIRDGLVWRSRTQFNVNEPRSDGVPTTWSRADGRYVVPAGWEYQPGEDLTDDDGETWWRVTQATSFSPSAFPAAYVQIDGPGGDPLPTTPQWIQPLGALDAYQLGEVVFHNNKTWQSAYNNNVWEPGVFGWTEVV